MRVFKLTQVTITSNSPGARPAASVGGLLASLYGEKSAAPSCDACNCRCRRPSPYCKLRKRPTVAH
jgi:hypothetical protein